MIPWLYSEIVRGIRGWPSHQTAHVEGSLSPKWPVLGEEPRVEPDYLRTDRSLQLSYICRCHPRCQGLASLQPDSTTLLLHIYLFDPSPSLLTSQRHIKIHQRPLSSPFCEQTNCLLEQSTGILLRPSRLWFRISGSTLSKLRCRSTIYQCVTTRKSSIDADMLDTLLGLGVSALIYKSLP
jgi:hypothetical protein